MCATTNKEGVEDEMREPHQREGMHKAWEEHRLAQDGVAEGAGKDDVVVGEHAGCLLHNVLLLLDSRLCRGYELISVYRAPVSKGREKK